MSDSRERIMDDVHGWALEKRDLSLYGNVAAFLRRLDNVRDEELRGLEEELEELSAALALERSASKGLVAALCDMMGVRREG